MNAPLSSSEYQRLNWKSTSNFYYPSLVRIRTDSDGSCFFHAITKAYFKPYVAGKLNGRALDRKKFIRGLRNDLSDKLASRVRPKDPESPIYYEILSRGELPKISESIPSYSLKSLQQLLRSGKPVDNIFNEFVSNELDKDIYILDYNKQDVYITGQDSDILYKDRDSIVILYIPGHYELIGVLEEGKIQTLFDPDHPFISSIRNRIIQNIR